MTKSKWSWRWKWAFQTTVYRDWIIWFVMLFTIFKLFTSPTPRHLKLIMAKHFVLINIILVHQMHVLLIFSIIILAYIIFYCLFYNIYEWYRMKFFFNKQVHERSSLTPVMKHCIMEKSYNTFIITWIKSTFCLICFIKFWKKIG